MLAAKARVILLILIITFLTGCWDRVEMEDRAFVIGIAIDVAEEEGKFSIIYQIALPGGMVGEGAGEGEAVWNVTTTAKTITEANKLVAVRAGRVINFHHLQAVVISDRIAEKGVSQFMDFFFRDFESRLHTHLLVAPEPAKSIMEVQPKMNPALAMYLGRSIDINTKNSGRTDGAIDMGKALGNFVRNNDFMVSRVVSGEDELKIAGAGIFREDRFVGWLGEVEIKYARFIIGDLVRSSFHIPNVQGKEVEVLVTETATKTIISLEGDKLHITTRIRAEGDIEEIDDIRFDSLDANFIRAVEKELEKNIIEGCHDIVTKAKYEFEAEFFDFGHKVKNQYPRYWRQVEENWREIFKDVVVTIEMDFNIRRLGLTR